METNSVAAAATLSLRHEPVADEQSVGGTPTTATAVLGEFGGLEVGVWEMTTGVMRDTEAEELFVVLSGAATIDFADDTPTMTIVAGDVVRFSRGAQTVWTVTETLRKVYLTT